MNAALNERI